MKLTIVESPYAGNIERNVAYARDALRNCLLRGESPLASHLLYTQPRVLDDQKPAERELGMRAGFAWAAHAQLVAVYTDLGVSPGMAAGIHWHTAHRPDIPVEYRTLPDWVVIGACALCGAKLFAAEGALSCAACINQLCVECGVGNALCGDCGQGLPVGSSTA